MLLLLAAAAPVAAAMDPASDAAADVGPKLVRIDVGNATVYDAAWSPAGDLALVAQGLPAMPALGHPLEKALVRTFDGKELRTVYEADGHQAVSVAWSAGGAYALVATTGKPILRFDPRDGSVTDLWDGPSLVQDPAQAFFAGHRVVFRPRTQEAWITGSSLLVYDGRTLQVADAGENRAWRALAWTDDGSYGLASAAEPDSEGKYRAGVLYGLRPDIQSFVPRGSYGKYSQTETEVHGVAWDAGRERFLVYGDDDFTATVLALGPEEWIGYLDWERPQARLHALAWRPGHPGAGLAAGEKGDELLETDGETFRPLLSDRAMSGKDTIYRALAWHPSGDRVLFGGFLGRFYELTLARAPLVRFDGLTGDVAAPAITGRAWARSHFDPLDRVEVRFDDGPWIPARLLPGVGLMANWSAPLPPAGASLARIRAGDGDTVSPAVEVALDGRHPSAPPVAADPPEPALPLLLGIPALVAVATGGVVLYLRLARKS